MSYRSEDASEAYRLAGCGLTPSDIITARYNLTDVLAQGYLSPVAAAVLADETATYFQVRLDQALDARGASVRTLMDSSSEWTFTKIGALLRITKQRARVVAERLRRP
ncbi:hypothetical protein [Frondihabitans sucicola]|uniref:hypothetical protein n=1 Tax=Frondihabitans sucicola TaxID=1268041 RepID=UPI0025746641|nr:hypothetical protein [Frondihabitans sucicola]